MKQEQKQKVKEQFLAQLNEFASALSGYVSTEDNQWTIKGFIDVFQNIYTISNDTKIVSKVLEIHLFPKFLEFANKYGYDLVLANKQNWYPDISFVSKTDKNIKFAIDLKTTFRDERNPEFCNGFTLGSHGEYFINRQSTKNIQFPYGEYLGHYCLGILYTRTVLMELEEAEIYRMEKLQEIPSVIQDFLFFACEKWQIASDKGGSGNTANIGSINKISDILKGNGVFRFLGEDWFDDYWRNFGKITILDKNGKSKKISSLVEFLKYRGVDENLVNTKAPYTSKPVQKPSVEPKPGSKQAVNTAQQAMFIEEFEKNKEKNIIHEHDENKGGL